MKIQKYIKDKQNKYKVIIDDCEYVLYDDVIVKYNLLLKNEINYELFQEIIKTNDELKSYYESIKYISKKIRSEKEIKDYLKKKEISDEIILKTIKKLKENNFINDDNFIKCYINDQINLSNNGPIKIKANLIKLGIGEDKINEKISMIDHDIWTKKIEKYIDKKIRCNTKYSSYYLKGKLKIELINLGYDKEMIDNLLQRVSIDDKEIVKKEYEKVKKVLEKKYHGYELDMKIKEKMYRKGFKVSEYEE